ncbi:MAG: stage III sporulation protein AG [Oscillospiraceae bacterium]|nr:stage III sporulation protein AG [Oscillospiraceae bacterium]
MDVITIKNKALEGIRKHKYALVVAAIGLLLICIPFGGSKPETQSQTQAYPTEVNSMEQRLEDILAKIDGAGKVQVMLTVSSSEKTVYQEDTDLSGGGADTSRYDTVIIKDSQGNELGLIQQVIGAKYQGAIIVCQGAGKPAVKLAIVEAVSRATGLGADQISVLKMK